MPLTSISKGKQSNDFNTQYNKDIVAVIPCIFIFLWHYFTVLFVSDSKDVQQNHSLNPCHSDPE